MANDDMHVIMYRILGYLYKCLKEGQAVDVDMFSAKHFNIPLSYWTEIMVQLNNRRYVTGFKVSYADNKTTVTCVDPAVTIDGVEFLMDNSLMKKAGKFLKDVGGVAASFISW